MDQVSYGASGLTVSAVGLGCNNFGWFIDLEQSKPVVHKALDLGVTLFDTADLYGTPPGNSEILLGEILHGVRQKVVLTTKFGVRLTGDGLDNSRSYIHSALEASLKRLRTDWIDIYMLHWPDHRTPTEEVLRAMDDLVTSGKVRYIACSNLPAWRVVEASWLAKEMRTHRFLACQVEYSLLERGPEAELIPALRKYGMSMSPYFPLASGMLTGKYIGQGEGRLQANFLRLGNRFLTDRNKRIVQELDAFARARDHSLVDLAMSWLACNPVVAGVIAGATKPEQVEQNVKAATWKLTPEDLVEIDKITGA
jgi:aryl-alcohol dehydrogenase-like predicted oxidoreductase